MLASIVLLGVIIRRAKIRPVSAARQVNRVNSAVSNQPKARRNKAENEETPERIHRLRRRRSNSEAAPFANPVKIRLLQCHLLRHDDNNLAAATSEYKRQLQQLAMERHLSSRLSIKGSGNPDTRRRYVRGARRHSQILGSAPSGVQIVDDISMTIVQSRLPEAMRIRWATRLPCRAARQFIITDVIGARAYLEREMHPPRGNARRLAALLVSLRVLTTCKFSSLDSLQFVPYCN